MMQRFKTLAAQLNKPGFALLLYLCLPNLPMLMSSWVSGSGIPRGIFNLECLVIGAIALFVPRWVAVTLLVAEMTFDYAYGLCFTYRFTLTELAASARSVSSLPGSRIWSGASVFVLILVCSLLLSMIRVKPAKRLLTGGILLAFAVAMIVADVFDGQNFLIKRDATLTQYRLVRSPVLILCVWQVLGDPSTERVNAASVTRMSSAIEHSLSALSGQVSQQPNLVLIVVESWGLHQDLELRNSLMDAYQTPELQRNYDVISGVAASGGLTVPGEARELCQSTLGFGILDASSQSSSSCLPAVLHVRGYESYALHGYLGQMFQRSHWYSKIGFDHIWFRPDFDKAGLPECPGPFPGTCDANLADWIGRNLLSTDHKHPSFIYWVTLNSHLPVPSRPALADDGVCHFNQYLDQSSALCSWYRLVRNVHQSVGRLATSAKRATVFVIVGDHTPPFGNPEIRRQFSGSEVPYVILKPRLDWYGDRRAMVSGSDVLAHGEHDNTSIFKLNGGEKGW